MATHHPFSELPAPKISKKITLGLYIIGGFLAILLIWSLVSKIDAAAISQGIVVIESRVKTIEHLEGGIVRDISVREGNMVEKGQVLVTLDDTQASTTLEVLNIQMYELLASAARFKAESLEEETITFPDRLLAEKDNPIVQDLMEGQEKIFLARKKTYQGRKEILGQQIQQIEKRIESLQAQVDSGGQQMEYIKEEITMLEELEVQNYIDRPRLLAVKREEAKLLGEIGEDLGMIASSEQNINEIHNEILSLDDEIRQNSLEELREALASLSDVIERRQAAEDVLARTKVVAPQSGKVIDLQVFTNGDVIHPGEMIMNIVPQEKEFFIETTIKPIDIDVVYEGLPAQVSLTAFNQREIPPLQGQVSYVSGDVMEDPNDGTLHYVAYIKIDPEEFEKLDEMQLYPGMPADVSIIVDRQTPFRYLVNPIVDSFGRAFKEP